MPDVLDRKVVRGVTDRTGGETGRESKENTSEAAVAVSEAPFPELVMPYKPPVVKSSKTASAQCSF